MSEGRYPTYSPSNNNGSDYVTLNTFEGRHSTYSPSNEIGSGYVTLKWFEGRLGNHMFQVAALFYVAVKTNREVVLFNDLDAHHMEEYFSLEVRRVNRSCPCFEFHDRFASYDSSMEEAIISESATNSNIIVLDGYFQSWKYFEPIDLLLRTRLKIRNSTETFARDFLRQVIPDGWTEGRFTRVGIHNRRGDFLWQMHVNSGFTTAPESYFQKAMEYFTDRYQWVQFIVTSDDVEWSRQHITYDNQSSSVNVTFSENLSAIQDLAILSLCNHVIVSTGTFGWMAAWLANGTTVYYANYPRYGSDFEKNLNRLDYYPPHWIPME